MLKFHIISGACNPVKMTIKSSALLPVSCFWEFFNNYAIANDVVRRAVVLEKVHGKENGENERHREILDKCSKEGPEIKIAN